ncbi:MerR family transcriptional regulator [Pelomonas sp. KK5]|uniref:MerR family transcriptional regulator n=1 Tax=Pelomonas sp. KK5 TaxID=1855730 RepID=UPI00097C2085|nr:MerR family transcriptional regulator [Pelomonas sp. KK5]
MRIGELAKQVSISTSAIRFYEASGLLPEGPRGHNRYREYGAEAIQRLQFIQLAQRLGFSLDSLRGLFALPHGEDTQAQIRAGLQRRREEIARLRAELEAQDAELQRLARECEISWSRGDCVTPDVFAAAQAKAAQFG